MIPGPAHCLVNVAMSSRVQLPRHGHPSILLSCNIVLLHIHFGIFIVSPYKIDRDFVMQSCFLLASNFGLMSCLILGQFWFHLGRFLLVRRLRWLRGEFGVGAKEFWNLQG